MTVLAQLNQALHTVLEENPSAYFLGEDILDPYGGAFKVSRGLSTRFPARVLTTPVSEAGFVGFAIGMALRGLRPIVEIMFGDFLLLAADQIVNHGSKYGWLYHERARVPLLLRTPMGGRRGYGATHSQSLEKMFLGVPGLQVVAPSTLLAGELLLRAAQQDTPVLFVEHKLLYAQPELQVGAGELSDFTGTATAAQYPTWQLSMRGAPHEHVALCCYGYNFEVARAAALRLAWDHEIFCRIVIISDLAQFDLDPLREATAHSGKLMVIEEGTERAGWGSHVAARLHDVDQRVRVKRIGALNLPLGSATALEASELPSTEDVVRRVREWAE